MPIPAVRLYRPGFVGGASVARVWCMVRFSMAPPRFCLPRHRWYWYPRDDQARRLFRPRPHTLHATQPVCRGSVFFRLVPRLSCSITQLSRPSPPRLGANSAPVALVPERAAPPATYATPVHSVDPTPQPVRLSPPRCPLARPGVSRATRTTIPGLWPPFASAPPHALGPSPATPPASGPSHDLPAADIAMDHARTVPAAPPRAVAPACARHPAAPAPAAAPASDVCPPSGLPRL